MPWVLPSTRWAIANNLISGAPSFISAGSRAPRPIATSAVTSTRTILETQILLLFASVRVDAAVKICSYVGLPGGLAHPTTEWRPVAKIPVTQSSRHIVHERLSWQVRRIANASTRRMKLPHALAASNVLVFTVFLTRATGLHSVVGRANPSPAPTNPRSWLGDAWGRTMCSLVQDGPGHLSSQPTY